MCSFFVMSITDFFQVQNVQKNNHHDVLSSKYKPTDLSQFLDNFKQKTVFKNWFKTFSKKGFIVTGKPGSGKTILSTLMCDHFNFSYTYFNSCDRFSKKDKINMFNDVKDLSKHVIIIDELESFSSFSDHIPISTITKWLEIHQIPIILIIQKSCLNKLSDCFPLCDSIELSFPSSKLIFNKCIHIIDRENIDIDLNQLTNYINSFDRDIRYIINNLREIHFVSKVDIHRDIYDSYRDINNYSTSLDDKLRIFQNDIGTIPVLLQENFINWNVSHSSLALIADSMSLGDLFHKDMFYSSLDHTMIGIYSVLSTITPFHLRHSFSPHESIKFGSMWTKQSSLYQKRKFIHKVSFHLNEHKLSNLIFFRQLFLHYFFHSDHVIIHELVKYYQLSNDDIIHIFKMVSFDNDFPISNLRKRITKINKLI